MFILRQLVEKRLQGQQNMSLGFIDLEKRDAHGHVEVDVSPGLKRGWSKAHMKKDRVE